MGTLNDAIQRERPVDLTKWQLVKGTTNEYERIAREMTADEREAEQKENRANMPEARVRTLLEAIIGLNNKVLKWFNEERAKNKTLEDKLMEAQMDINSLERMVERMRDNKNK